MIRLSQHEALPIHRRLYQAIRDDVLSQRLAPGTRMPASRTAAADLGVSRNSVLQAYEQLTAEGYLQTRQGAGTFVRPTSQHQPKPSDATPAPLQPRYSTTQQQLAALPPTLIRRNPRTGLAYDFAYGEPAYADLPMASWARILGRTARSLTQGQLSYAPHAGLLPLRQAIAGYLQRNRGVHCDPEQIVIVQGTQEAIDLTVRLLINPGDTAVVEEPQYRGFVRSLLGAGAQLAPIAVDQHGLCCDHLDHIDQAKLICVTPAHQFPTGSVMSAQRRLNLLEWAAQQQTLVLEDDYDGEFRYGQQPMPSLQSLDRHGSVIYVGTASKILFPALRIGWMVVPRGLYQDVLNIKAMADTWPSSLEQLALAAFIEDGHLERHVQRLRRRLASKRQVLLDTLEQQLGDQVSVIGSQAGIHVLLRLHNMTQHQLPAFIEQCAQHQVGVYSAAPYYRSPPDHAELILGYAALSETQIEAGIIALARRLSGFAANG